VLDRRVLDGEALENTPLEEPVDPRAKKTKSGAAKGYFMTFSRWLAFQNPPNSLERTLDLLG